MSTIAMWPSSLGIPFLEDINPLPHLDDPPAGQAIPYVRLWSIVQNRIQWSDDYGETWTYSWNNDQRQLPVLTPAPGPEPTLFRDSRGHFYYCAQNDAEEGGLYRVSWPDFFVERVIRFKTRLAPKGDGNRHGYQHDSNPFAKTPYLKPWGISEDSDGTVYVGQYSFVNIFGSSKIPIQAAYLWKSQPDDFTRTPEPIFSDFFAHQPIPDYSFPAGPTDKPPPDGQRPDEMHIHVVKCDPFPPCGSRAVYVTTGDNLKRFVVVKDGEIENDAKFHVIDANQNPSEFKSGYTAIAFMNKEVWALTLCSPTDRIPGTTASLLSGVAKLTRTGPQTCNWYSRVVFAYEPKPSDPTQADGYGGRFIYLCEDRKGRIPESCPYVFAVFYVPDAGTWQLVKISRTFPQ